ncbi:MAG: hypothetical protein ACTSRE_11445 [Promethearchaeota archaeon]
MSRNGSIEVERTTGAKRNLVQIQKTMKFEFKRNWIKLMTMIGTAVLIYVLNIVIIILQINRLDVEPVATAIEYMPGYFGGLFPMLIYIIGVTFAGSMIVEDFEKATGNLLFPKIPKYRLLIGRYIARYLYAIVAILAYYILVGITTLIQYSEVPVEVLLSFGWAAFYMFAVMAFVTFFSSFFRRTSGAIVVSLIALIMVFQMVTSIFSFSGITAEPFYFLTHYAGIISNIFAMPEARFAELAMGPGGHTFYQWITPSEIGAAIGLLVYTVVMLAGAYFFYQRRQNKANV